MNSFNALGRIAFIETSHTKDMAVCKFSLAINRRGSKSSENKSDFIPCVAFGKTAENISRFFGKGSRILIEGALQSNRYEKDGKNITSYNVVVNAFHFVDSKSSEQGDHGEPEQEDTALPFDL